MRIVFLGNDPWSVPPLSALRASAHEVVAVITEPPKPAGRGRDDRPTAVATAARELGIRVIEHGDGPLAPVIAEMHPDVLAVVAYGRLLPQGVLDLPTAAPLNLHFSLLPELRGASPVRTAILRGDRITGVTVMRMVAALDAGPIYSQREVEIGEDEDAGTLGGRLAEIGADELVATVDALSLGTAVATPQDESRATTCGKFGPQDRRLLWEVEDARRTVARVRALSPDPGASTDLRGQHIRVLAARVEDPDAPPSRGAGAIVAVDRDGIVVSAARGTVRLLELVPAGRARMSASAYAAGARPEIGERLS